MLVDAGCIIIPWDWRDFAKMYITKSIDKCKAALNEMTGHIDGLYDKRFDETKKVVNHKMRRANYHHNIMF